VEAFCGQQLGFVVPPGAMPEDADRIAEHVVAAVGA
jgi:hypothetical protein